MARKILTPEEINDFSNHLYGVLPSVYRYADETEGLMTLHRFLDALNSGGYAHVNNQIVGLLELSQVKECPEEYLYILGNSLGCDWVNEIPMRFRRKLIELLIPLYKKKGTMTSITYLAKELSGFEVEYIEGEIPDEYYEEGDEKKRLFTIKLLAPEVDDPVQSQESEATITKIISHFVPVHSKYIVLVTYFYNESHIVSSTEELIHKIKEDRGVESLILEGDCIQTYTIKNVVDQETKFSMFTDPTLLPEILDKMVLKEGEYDYNKSSIEELNESNKLKTLNETIGDLRGNVSQSDEVMVKCKLETPDARTLGTNKQLFKTCSYQSKLNDLNVVIAIPGVVTKITTASGEQYIYD